MSEPCPACKSLPCDGTHVRCTIEVYAAHRGLSVEQIGHRARFERAQILAYAKRFKEELAAGMHEDLKRWL